LQQHFIFYNIQCLKSFQESISYSLKLSKSHFYNDVTGVNDLTYVFHSPSKIESIMHLYIADLEHTSCEMITKSCCVTGRNQATSSVSGWMFFITSNIGSPKKIKEKKRTKYLIERYYNIINMLSMTIKTFQLHLIFVLSILQRLLRRS